MTAAPYFIAGMKPYVHLHLPTRPVSPLFKKKKNQLNNGFGFPPSAHPFFHLSPLILCHPVFKKRLTDAPSAGAPFHHMLNPLLAFFSQPPHNKSGIAATLRNML